MRLVAVLMLLPAVAFAGVDLDEDGTPDRIEVTGAELSIQTTKLPAAKVALGRAMPHATVAAAVVRGTPTIVVTADDEAIVIERDGGWKIAMRQPVGGIGLDREYGYAIEPTAAALVRYQVRPGFQRCDGKPAYLFAEAWTGGKWARLSRLPTEVPDSAPVIAAKADAAGPALPVMYQARVASYQPGAGDAGGLGIPAELDDGALATGWHEEFVKSDGEGQFFTFEPRSQSAKAAQVRIVPGDPQSAAKLRASNRPKRIAVVAAQGAWRIDLPDAVNDPIGTAYVADLPVPISGCVSVVLETTYGPPTGTTAIAELEVFAEGERAGGGDAMLAAAVAEGRDAQSAGQELARRGAQGVAAIEAELGKTSDAEARRRLVRALLPVRDPSAGPAIAHAVAQDWVRDADLNDAIAALGALAQFDELRELAGKKALGLEARIAAVHALAGKPEAALSLAGNGPRELRHAVIEVITAAPSDALAKAAASATSPSASGDTWRALTRRAHANAGERAVALAAMTAALPAATDYERRYRLVDGLAAIGDAGALSALEAMLRALPRGAERAAFEQIAVRAIAVNPRPDAIDLVIEYARDADPGVRLAALDALATAESGAAGPWHVAAGPDGIDRVIVTALATDLWPEVRRKAAQVLGGRCARIGPARALADALARDPEVGVRADALAGLVECKAAGIGELLAKTWDDGKAPLELRQRAVDLSYTLGDRALGAKLIARFAAWRGAALESADALALAQNAAYALGRLAPPGAAEALSAGLDDAGFPEIVAASATGLGLMGHACPAGAKTKLRAMSHSDDATIATAAARAAAVCGK